MKNLGRLFCVIILTWPGVSLGQRSGGERFEEERSRVVIRNLTRLNTEYFEFSPTYFKDGLVFVSSRRRIGYIDKELGEPYFDLFFTELQPDGNPGRIKPFSMELNSPWHEGPVAFSEDFSRVYFTRNNYDAGGVITNDDGRVVLKIYEAKWGQYNDWSDVQEMAFNQNESTTMHPTLTPDGNRMFFASDRPGGFGQNDIYMVEKLNGKWSNPINLGPDVNTAGNEVTPFYHSSGYFFFASNGHPGKGGMDLFMIDMGNKKMGEVTNIGQPFNTPDDDFGFLMHPSGTRGYFSSNRQDGLGKDDIYMFYIPDGSNGIEPTEEIVSQVRIWDERTRRALEGVSVYLLETDDFGERVKPTLNTNNRPITISELVEDPSLIRAPSLITGPRGSGSLTLDPEKAYTILFAKPGLQTERIKLYAGGMPPAIDIKLKAVNCIRLSGSVQDGGSGGVVEGVRVRIKNECSGESEELRSDRTGKFSYCLEIGCDFSITGEKEGYEMGITTVSTERLRGNRLFRASLKLRPVNDVRGKGGVEKGSMVKLSSISFHPGTSSYAESPVQILRNLSSVLRKYPDLDIEIGAHTGSKGDHTMNQRLSLRRAEMFKSGLMELGIPSRRIQAFGYGESLPIKDCSGSVPCTEQEQLLNERLEITISNGTKGLTWNQFVAQLYEGIQ